MPRLPLALALTLALPLGLLPAAAQETKPLPRTITVQGHGEVQARPDYAVVSVGVLSTAETAKAALEANTRSMQAIFAALKAAGLEDRDMQTSNFSVAPRYDYGQNNTGQPPKLVGYDVSNMVTIKVRRIAALGAVLDAAVGQGSNQIQGIAFSIDDPEPLEDEARRLAVADAERKAKLLTGAARVTLGAVMTITEVAGTPPYPIPYAKQARAESDQAVPIAQGEQTVAVDVSVQWEIK
jgi:uncharacterized protein